MDNELSRALDALSPTDAMRRADFNRLLARRRRRVLDIGAPLALAGAACAAFFALAQPVAPPLTDDGGDIFISIDDGTGPLVISVSSSR